MLCQMNTRMVDAMAKEHTDKFTVSFRPREDHKEELAAHGIASHGIVCLDADGELLWMHGDHKITQAEFDEGVKVVLGKLGG